MLAEVGKIDPSVAAETLLEIRSELIKAHLLGV
jgi:hypothetical protein